MEDLNQLLHDQQLVLLKAQFADCGQRQALLRKTARAIGERIGLRPYRRDSMFKPYGHRLGCTVSSVSVA